MTDFERRIKTKLIEDEYAEKFRRSAYGCGNGT